jgi:uroporphyrinogen decarboxylase
MNLRRQLLDAIQRRRPERIPYTYGALPETEAALRRYIGLDEKVSVESYFGCNRFVGLWSLLGGAPTMPERTRRLQPADPNATMDPWGVVRERKQAGKAVYYEITRHPLAGAETVADIERYDWPRPEEVLFPELPAQFDPERARQDSVILEMGYIGPFGIPWALRGMERMMTDLVLCPALVEAMVAKVEEFTLGCLRIVLEKYPGLVDGIGCGDDYGTQNNLLLSARMIERFFMPSLKRHYDLGRKHGVFGYHHCCGAIFEIIPLFIAAGVQVLNPIQTSAQGMDPERLKSEFGGDLCFHGGMDIQQTLVRGTQEEVREEVRARISTLGPEGYILAPSHTLQPDAPPENIVAMYEEAGRHGPAT